MDDSSTDSNDALPFRVEVANRVKRLPPYMFGRINTLLYNKRRSGDDVLRTYGVGAQILRDLGLTKMRVLSAPKHMYAISGFDLEITEYVE